MIVPLNLSFTTNTLTGYYRLLQRYNIQTDNIMYQLR